MYLSYAFFMECCFCKYMVNFIFLTNFSLLFTLSTISAATLGCFGLLFHLYIFFHLLNFSLYVPVPTRCASCRQEKSLILFAKQISQSVSFNCRVMINCIRFIIERCLLISVIFFLVDSSTLCYFLYSLLFLGICCFTESNTFDSYLIFTFSSIPLMKFILL
jgi:hypothetical protein